MRANVEASKRLAAMTWRCVIRARWASSSLLIWPVRIRRVAISASTGDGHQVVARKAMPTARRHGSGTHMKPMRSPGPQLFERLVKYRCSGNEGRTRAVAASA